MSDFAKRMRKIRESRGDTAYELAKETGLSQQGILNLEKEGSDPKVSTVIKIAEALHCGPWELLPDARRPPLRPGDIRDVQTVCKAARQHYAKIKPILKKLQGLMGQPVGYHFAPGVMASYAQALDREMKEFFQLFNVEEK
jgi:transcriptional regulator with XRE-family HTH domain